MTSKPGHRDGCPAVSAEGEGVVIEAAFAEVAEEDEGVARAEAGSTMALQRRSSKLEYANTRVRERLSAS